MIKCRSKFKFWKKIKPTSYYKPTTKKMEIREEKKKNLRALFFYHKYF